MGIAEFPGATGIFGVKRQGCVKMSTVFESITVRLESNGHILSDNEPPKTPKQEIVRR